MRHYLFFIFLLLVARSSFAQVDAIDKHIGIEEGLSNNYIIDIAIDGNGYAWVATESGLNRIAGNTCSVFRTNNTSDNRISGILSNTIRKLYYDRQTDKMLIATEDGLSVYECKTGRFHNITTKEGLGFPVINYIANAGNGKVWLILAHGRAQLMDCDTYELKTLQTHVKDVRSAMDDGNGHLYLGHQLHDGLTIVDTKTGHIRNYRHQDNDPQSLPGNNVRCIYQDHLKNIWVGTNMGLALFDPQGGTFRRVASAAKTAGHAAAEQLRAENVYDIKEIKEGELWVACDMGGISVIRLDRVRTAKSIGYDNSIRIPSTSINTRCITRDEFGNVWIGNYSTGVDFIAASKPPFHTFPYYDEEHRQKRIYGVACDSNGSIWLGGEDEVTQTGKGTTKVWTLRNAMNRRHSFVMCVMADSQDCVWLGVEDDGVLRLNPRSGQLERIDIGHSVADIRSFYEDHEHRVWIGSDMGVYTWKDGHTSCEQALNDSLGMAVAFGIIEIGGEILISTNFGELLVFNPTTKNIRRINGRMMGDVANGRWRIGQLLADSQQGIWMATSKGLAYVENINRPESLEMYHAVKDGYDKQILAIQQDRSGRIWCSTYTGISCFDPRKKTFYSYNHMDNLPSGSFVAGSATTAPDGTIFFGSPSGACYFDPQLIDNSVRVSDVQIISCEAYRPTGENASTLQLMPDEKHRVFASYEENTLRISFSVKNYAEANNVEYSYRMEGLDEQWYTIDNDHYVIFRNLQPGKYTFQLRAKQKNQDWQDATSATLAIRISPPFWQTWWAYLVYVMMAVALIMVLLRSYKHRLQLKNSLELERREGIQKQELNEERLHFFTNVTHELRTPLTLILGPLEDLTNDSHMPENYRRKVELIHKSAGRLRDLINQILEFRKTETQNRRLTVAKGDLGELVMDIGLYFKQLNRKPGVTVRIFVRPDIPPIYYDSEVVTTILNNLLSNAVKYTDKGHIDLIMETDNQGQLSIVVKDTGYGIAPDALPHIFDRYYQAKGKHQASGTGIGLALAKSLADLHEGRLSVESKLGKGSTFTFSILIGNSYPNALHKEDKDERKEEREERIAEHEEVKETDDRPLLLVVEDNEDIRQYIADSMADDYRILQAGDGQEGERLAIQQIPDIIVSDIMMPKMDGIELTRRVKEDIRTSHIPIILLTAKDTIEDKLEGYDSGADSYLTKPFSARLLQSRIQNLMANRRRQAELLVFNRATETAAPPAVEVPRLSRLDQEFIDKMNRIIEENITTENLDLNFMTDKLAMSHSTLYRKIKALTGMSAKEYIRKLRLQRSFQLLESGDYNVTEAAAMTGFNDMGHFREIFKKEFGILPSEVRKK